jgi:hypothetical protein
MWGPNPAGGMMKLGTFVDSPDVINHANFHWYLMTSLLASDCQKSVLPLKCKWLLQHCFALPRWQVILYLRKMFFSHALIYCLVINALKESRSRVEFVTTLP